MLSNAAANSLLKTLEEPPSHVVFVLATTDPQKVPATIRSRTQHLEFRLLGADTLQSLLESVTGAAPGSILMTAPCRRRFAGATVRPVTPSLRWIRSWRLAQPRAARPELSSVVSAIAECEVADVLVTLSALLADGWGPQQLATELVDDLRQVFLAALAPELCSGPDPSAPRSAHLAEAMGLARVVRSMEILGHALIDMRDAPDAQVVLEIALVRAARPDLDQSTAALAERVGDLGARACRRRPWRPVNPKMSESPSRWHTPSAEGDGVPKRRSRPSARRSARSGAAKPQRLPQHPAPAVGRAGSSRSTGRRSTGPNQQPTAPAPQEAGTRRLDRSGQPHAGMGRRGIARLCRPGRRRSTAPDDSSR